MNKEQIAKLRKMTRGEIARKYTPLLIKGQITSKQYEWLINQGQSVSDNILSGTGKTAPSQSESQSSTKKATSRIPETSNKDEKEIGLLEAIDNLGGKLSQTERLEILLSDGEWHDTVEILEKVYGNEKLGLARIGARIYDLKQKGLNIIGERKKDTIWKYKKI